jgi:molybdate transport system substrate-binding protein
MPAARRFAVMLATAVAGWSLSHPIAAQEPKRPVLVVLAAASLTNVLGDLSSAWTSSSGIGVKLSFAASSALARQIEAGGQADLFISADQEWMDYLQQRGLLQDITRRNLAGNRLVLIAPADSKVELKIAPGFRLAEALGHGRLSTGDPDTVPVGKYARSALVSLGIWDKIQDRLVRAENVRSAMMFVARGEAPLGIVYSTDAIVDPKVRIVDVFPANSHPPITYPGATVQHGRPEAIAYLNFLSSPQARDTWKKYGFWELH